MCLIVNIVCLCVHACVHASTCMYTCVHILVCMHVHVCRAMERGSQGSHNDRVWGLGGLQGGLGNQIRRLKGGPERPNQALEWGRRKAKSCAPEH